MPTATITTTSNPTCCPTCDLLLANNKASHRHQKVHQKEQCKQCKHRFLELEDLRNHQQETSHLYCSECSIYFPDFPSHTTHVRDVQHTAQYHCCDCGREYAGQESLDNHCCDCDRVFRCPRKLKRHFTQRAHLRNIIVLEASSAANLPHRCGACDKRFSGKGGLRNHMRSKHKPPRHIPCPVGGKCSKKFATLSALLNHLESGCCHSGMTRDKMNEFVFAHDPNHHITSMGEAGATTPSVQKSASPIPSAPTSIAAPIYNLLENEFTALPPIADDDTLSEWSSVGEVALTPTTSEGTSGWAIVNSAPLTPIMSADGSDWSFMSRSPIYTPSNTSPSEFILKTVLSDVASPRNLRCQLCPPGRKAFGTVRALQAHAASAAHAPKIFHCPLSFMPNVKPEDLLKRRRFSTLSGLTQHVESGSCGGGIELYKKAIKFVEERLNCLGFDSMRLLLD